MTSPLNISDLFNQAARRLPVEVIPVDFEAAIRENRLPALLKEVIPGKIFFGVIPETLDSQSLQRAERVILNEGLNLQIQKVALGKDLPSQQMWVVFQPADFQETYDVLLAVMRAFATENHGIPRIPPSPKR